MDNRRRTNKAFTLIELVVAIAILAMMSGFAGVIFNVSVGSHRAALANADIMQRLRAITDQLDRDFKGIRQDAPMAIQFWRDVDGTRRDSITFFANGDFQSIRQYLYDKGGTPTLRTVSGNVASIYYGRAYNDPNILARKQKILTSDTSMIYSPLLYDANEFLIDSLAVWRVDLNDISFVDWVTPPDVDPRFEEDLPLYVTGDVNNFMIQVAEWNLGTGTFIWFPDNSDSIFENVLVDSDDNDRFGFFYNVPGGLTIADWTDLSANWPRAIKFTFMLYDSRGIITEGRTFTHIVYIGD